MRRTFASIHALDNLIDTRAAELAALRSERTSLANFLVASHSALVAGTPIRERYPDLPLTDRLLDGGLGQPPKRGRIAGAFRAAAVGLSLGIASIVGAHCLNVVLQAGRPVCVAPASAAPVPTPAQRLSGPGRFNADLEASRPGALPSFPLEDEAVRVDAR